MVQKPLIKQGYSLAAGNLPTASVTAIWAGVWYRWAGVATGSGGGSQCQRHGDNQLQPLWRQYDPAVPRFDALSRHSSSTGKMWLKKFDHCAIYLLIAGTYTPFLLVGLDSPLARGLMIVIWSLALLGILFKLTIAHRFKILSLVTYLAMGWLSLVVIYEMAVKLAAGSVTLLAVGGVVYSLGVIFYVCKRIPYNHAIWHGFVLGGSVCHFLAIYLYIGQV